MSSPRLYKYSGAGNDFIVLKDCAEAGHFRSEETICSLCDRTSGFVAADGTIGADGLMILSESCGQGCDFSMEYYNSDGSGGMMCGNGGRCIVAFASLLGIRPGEGRREYVFSAADGLHRGEILCSEGNSAIVRISMIDPLGLREVLGGYFLNTGTRHFVLFVDDAEAVDVALEGARLRHSPEFAPEGTNVNFVESLPDGTLKIRTFEKGVEAETLACGTGITAAAVAAYAAGIRPAEQDTDGRVRYLLHARRDDLLVDFVPGSPATGVRLTGPAVLVQK